MEVTEDEVKTTLGKRLTFGIVHKEPAVLIIPWDGSHFYLVGQYRYPVDAYSWEFPQGHFEHTSIMKTAREELREECGLTAAVIREVAAFNLAPGHHTQRYRVFLASDLSRGIRKPEASEEGMRVKAVTMTELQNMIANGRIQDAPTIAAFGIIMAKRLFQSS